MTTMRDSSNGGQREAPSREAGRRNGSGNPIQRLSRTNLDSLLAALEVDCVALSECVVAGGWRLVIGQVELPGLHYVLSGSGEMTFDNGDVVAVRPHTLVMIPPRQQIRVDVPGDAGVGQTAYTAQLLRQMVEPTRMPRRFVAGEPPELTLICGYFSAQHRGAIDLFSRLSAPLVERFDTRDRLDDKLKEAMVELGAQELGTGIMTASLMKQVFVVLFRRALVSSAEWVQRLSLLGDPQIARAFAEMVSHPGAAHSVQSLAQCSGLSRSIFMDRFGALFGRAPMAVLRELRMQQAAQMLSAEGQFVDRVAHAVGYANRSSFCRAFRKAHGSHPSDFRALGKGKPGSERSQASDD